MPNNKLLVFNRVQNVRTTPCTVELRYAVEQEGKAVGDVAIPSQPVTLQPGEIAEVKAVCRRHTSQDGIPGRPFWA